MVQEHQTGSQEHQSFHGKVWDQVHCTFFKQDSFMVYSQLCVLHLAGLSLMSSFPPPSCDSKGQSVVLKYWERVLGYLARQ